MEKAYNNVAYFFIFILVLVVWGFYRSYFGLFPSFNGITTVQHFHGLMFLLWFAMLIIQPFLIRYGKYNLHRNLGKLSYALVPLLLLSIFLVSKAQYHRMATMVPAQQNIAVMALNIPDIFAFAALYMLAMVNKKNSSGHMRYMIGTSLLLIGPGIGRAVIIYFGMPFPQGVSFALFFTELMAVILIIYDLVKGNSVKPYLVTLLIIAALHLTWIYQLSWWWQSFGKWFANSFF